MNNLNEIQRLRGVACLLVFCQHVCCVVPLWYLIKTIPRVFHYASAGVHIFFMISGFVIAMSMKEKLEKCCTSDDFAERLYAAKNELKAFFVKRCFRLLPAFLVSVLIVAGFEFFFAENMSTFTQACRMPIDVLTTAHNDNVARLCEIENIYYSSAGLYWTLSVEVLFYMIWPVMFLALKNNSVRVKVSLITGLVLWTCARWIMFNIIKEPELIYYSSMTNLDGLFLGSFLGLMYRNNGEGKPSNMWCIVSVILVLLMWTQPNMFVKRHMMWQNSAVMVSFILVALAAYGKGVFNIPVLRSFLEYLGGRSYSFYIYQMFLIYAVSWFANSSYFHLTGDAEFKTAMIFIVVLFTFTEISYRFIEQPCRKLGNRIAASFK